MAGNGTLEEAGQLGIEKVIVVETSGNELVAVKRSGLTEEQWKQYAIADNTASDFSTWDASVLSEIAEQVDLDGFFPADKMDEVLAELAKQSSGFTEQEEDEDDLQDVLDNVGKVESRVKLGDIWALGRHRLLVGDSTDPDNVRRLLGDKKPVLMVTDQPYGVEYDPNWRNEAAEKGLISYAARSVGKVSNDDRVDWSDVYRLFDPQVIYAWHAGKHASEVQESLENSGYQIVSQIIWAKPTFAISRGDYHWQHEPCWYAVRKGSNHNWQGSRSESTLWSIERGCTEKTGHGTEKPLECMERPIRNNSKEDDLIVDPFLGSGTTLIAAEKTGRVCYGCEIDLDYATVIIERWERYTNQFAELITPTDKVDH